MKERKSWKNSRNNSRTHSRTQRRREDQSGYHFGKIDGKKRKREKGKINYDETISKDSDCSPKIRRFI